MALLISHPSEFVAKKFAYFWSNYPGLAVWTPFYAAMQMQNWVLNPYLMTGLKLMYFWLMDFDEIYKFQSLNTQEIRGFHGNPVFSELSSGKHQILTITKDHLPRKVTLHILWLCLLYRCNCRHSMRMKRNCFRFTLLNVFYFSFAYLLNSCSCTGY